MTKNDVDMVSIENHIKLFLDSCHHFCIATHDNTYQEVWSGKANFPSLLNLPRQIEHFGKLWWYWEGNRKRFIQTIKSQILALRQAYSYYESKLSMITRLNTFCWIEEDLFCYKEEKELVDKLFHVYQNKHEILLRLELGKPISAMYIEGRLQIVFVSYSTGRYDIELMPIKFDPNSLSEEVCGLVNCRFYIEDNNNSVTTEKNVVLGLTNVGAILLPLNRAHNNNFCGQFTAIYSD